jgi:hypothetical protein
MGMVNGQWAMVNGQWSMHNGQWSLVLIDMLRQKNEVTKWLLTE